MLQDAIDNHEAQPLVPKSSTALIIKQLQTNPPISLPQLITRKAKLKQILPASIVELLNAYIFSFITCQFLAPGSSWFLNPFNISSAVILINLFLRYIDLNLTFSFRLHGVSFSISPVALGRSFAYSLIMYDNLGVLGHEEGHAYMAKRLYENANTHIEITPGFFGFTGLTTWNDTTLTHLGTQLGSNNSAILAKAGGSLAMLLESFASLTIAQCISNTYPELKRHIRASVLCNLFFHFQYALMPYFIECDDKTNDFCALEKHDIPPAAAGFTMVGALFLFQVLLNLLESCCCQSKQEDNDTSSRFEEITETASIQPV